MKFLADESLEGRVVRGLREASFDVLAIAETRAGASDRRVLQLASRSKRILITNDKDFAELVFLRRILSPGIVLIRMPRSSSERKLVRIAQVLREPSRTFAGALTVIQAEGVRRRVYP